VEILIGYLHEEDEMNNGAIPAADGGGL
jgi:hypothetical protein